ncbi:rhamnogalacturonan acetylesterase [Asticcacaulis sp. EMRT-3]|uniref:rhamnogalacturonan acetylesterase n=1 Tax=Asticcacaulis sp. EMRT-3 TaxID=3040349 RepID=UPI0024AF2945|nr:rhamnogalacturonan acetylesterase [Asticcacaulis sp. EMRT-3]MDI7776422.1 rhamnogalacturonan acetylesterase [Asticcacaulis sp. EMRT-3]
MTVLPATAQNATQTFVFQGAQATIRPAAPWDEAKGYGFTSLPGGNEQAFSLRAAPGDYRVTVTLGDKTASRTTIWAEDRRLMAAPVDLKAGETKQVSFIVNVRDTALVQQETDPAPPKVRLRGDDATGRTWDGRLTISVSGPSPALDALSVTPVQARRVLLAGDSTVTDQASGDYASWGQMLPRMLGPDLSVANHARSGETMKSFLTSLRWDKLLSEVRPDDVVLIQFAHNDEKKQWPRTYAAPDEAYPAYLAAFVADVRQHGGLPVLVTPVARRTFKGQVVEDSHAGYDEAVRDVAKRLNVPLVDLTAQTTQFYEALGPELAPLAFADNHHEKTHHDAYGAYMIACFVAHDLAAMPDLHIQPAPDLPACDPGHPGDPHQFVITPADWPIMRKHVDQAAEPTPLK